MGIWRNWAFRKSLAFFKPGETSVSSLSLPWRGLQAAPKPAPDIHQNLIHLRPIRLLRQA